MSKQTRAIVIGAGPVGLVAALRLVRAGFDVQVLEQAAELHAEPRASTFHPPTLELLDSLAITEELIALGRVAQRWQYRIFKTGEHVVFDTDILADETRYPFRLQCEQFKLVVCAANRLTAEAPGALRFGVKATAVRQTGDQVQVSIESNGATDQLSADWVLGCDGASSIARSDLGLSFEGDTYPSPNVTLGTSFDFEGHIPGLLGVNYFWSDFGSFSMFHTKDMWRVGFSPPAGMSDAEAVSAANVQAMLQRILPRAEDYPIATARIYRIHRRLASTFRVGRIFLAGDAAHVNSPSGGFGMNGGVQDAFSLTERLIAVERGADMDLLDRYTRQRRSAAFEDIQSTSHANHTRHRGTTAENRRAVLADLQAIAADPARRKTFLMENTLITSWRRAEAVP